jgi:ribosome biogenesis SPOUT family RNA methylase Rps3
MDGGTDEVLSCRVVIEGVDRARVELLLLEVRRLARRHGVEVAATSIERAEPPPTA